MIWIGAKSSEFEEEERQWMKCSEWVGERWEKWLEEGARVGLVELLCHDKRFGQHNLYLFGAETGSAFHSFIPALF
jgi:hypothetical protein